MSTMPVSRSATSHLGGAFAAVLRPVRDFLVMLLNARDAAYEAENLSEMSDASLALRGLTRSEIGNYVYRKYM